MGRHSDSLFDWMSYFGSSRKLIPMKIENDVPYWNPFPFSGGLIFRRGAELMAIILPLFSCYGIHPNLSEQKYCKIQKMQTWVVLASNTDFFFTFLSAYRLMIVSYYVDKDSGFVPTITFEDNYAPEWE